MVQVFDPTPVDSSASMIGESLGTGLAKRMGLMEAENAFRDARGDPLKLATAMGRLVSISPDMARAAGPMYDAMLRNMQTDATRKGAGGTQGQPGTENPLSQSLRRSGQMPSDLNQMIQQGQEPIPLQEATPRIQEKGIAAEETLPKPYWTSQQRLANIRNYLDMGFLIDKAEQLSERDEKAYMSNPDQFQKRYELLEQKKKDAQAELIRQLETKTQTKLEAGPNQRPLFEQIPGEYLIGMEKGLERDIRENPNKTVDQIADEWSTKALNTVKAKDEFITTASTQGIENLFKGTSTLNKYNEYSDIFKKSGNSEEYYNLLRQHAKTSPQGSASIAFKLRPDLQNIIRKNIPEDSIKSFDTREKDARQLANLLTNKINSNDSLLSVAWSARKRNPSFDERAFFDQISKNKDTYNLNPRQEREIAQGESDIRKYWGDFLIFPWLGE